jgi:hypothetical protein
MIPKLFIRLYYYSFTLFAAISTTFVKFLPHLLDQE